MTNQDMMNKNQYLHPSYKWIVNAISKQSFDETMKIPVGSYYERLYFKVVDVNRSNRKVYYFSDPETAEKWINVEFDANTKEKWRQEETNLRNELRKNGKKEETVVEVVEE